MHNANTMLMQLPSKEGFLTIIDLCLTLTGDTDKIKNGLAPFRNHILIE